MAERTRGKRRLRKTTSIEWTDHSWNPWRGCARVSPGCANCYMFAGQKRYGRDPSVVVRAAHGTFFEPLKWQARAEAEDVEQRVFTCSWSDWFIREADPWRAEAWGVIERCPRLIFQVLTKRHARIEANLPDSWGDGWPNVWLGVSGEDHDWTMRRVRALAEVPAAVKFLSYEPALGPVDWDRVFSIHDPATGGPALDWVIVGGESGGGARPFDVAWARAAVEACKRHGVAAFVKQMGARPSDNGGLVQLRDRKGGDWSEWPADLRVREWPKAGRVAV